MYVDPSGHDNVNITIDGKQQKFAGVEKNGTTYVNLRDIAPALGYKVSWDGKNTAYVKDKNGNVVDKYDTSKTDTVVVPLAKFVNYVDSSKKISYDANIGGTATVKIKEKNIAEKTLDVIKKPFTKDPDICYQVYDITIPSKDTNNITPASSQPQSSIPTATSNNGQYLGMLSAKYESKGDPGIIGNNPGDPGGKSYGAYQFNTVDGVVIDFHYWTETKNKNIFTKLNEAYNNDGNTNGSNFDTTWGNIANENSSGFWQLQHDYTKEKYYEKAAEDLNAATGFDINSQSFALQNVFWSTAVQHGVSGAVSLFQKANLSNGTQEEIINQIYDERSKVDIYFSRCSDEIKASAIQRFIDERKDAIKLL